jgi:GrpB-like predicted nucleotidyltransferase (UPF0157 family)
VSKEAPPHIPDPDEPTLGVPRNDVRLVPYDPRWVEAYRIAVSELQDCLGGRISTVEHIGSTAIPFWVGRIAFRDALRSNPEWAQEYGTLKRRLAQQYPHNRLAYTQAKEPFIVSVMAKYQLGVP